MNIFKKKKNILIIVLTLFCMIFCFSNMVKRINESQKMKRWKRQYLDIAKDVDERVKVGAYSFRLKNVYYDINSRSGYCYIEVKSDKKNVRKLHINKFGSMGSVWNEKNDTEFELYINGFSRQEIHSCLKGKTLCLLIFFEDAEDMMEKEISISLGEYGVKEEKMNIYYPDNLSHKYVGDNEEELWVTQYLIKSNLISEELDNMSILFKNGQEKVCVKDGNMVGKATSRSYGSNDDNQYFEERWIYYGEYVDYKKIDYILLNGKKFKEETVNTNK